MASITNSSSNVASQDARPCVSVDFGTSTIAVAFTLGHRSPEVAGDVLTSPEDIYEYRQWPLGAGSDTLVSRIQYSPEGEVRVGFEVDDYDPDGVKIDFPKLLLWSDDHYGQVRAGFADIPPNKHHLTVPEIVSQVLRYVGGCIRAYLHERFGIIDHHRIEWIFSLPVSLDNAGRDVLEEAIVAAGMGHPGTIPFYREQRAAAVEAYANLVLERRNIAPAIVLVDVGGGSVDIEAFVAVPSSGRFPRLRSFLPASSLPVTGGVYLNRLYRNLVVEKLARRRRDNHSTLLAHSLNHFETQVKRRFGRSTRVEHLKGPLIDLNISDHDLETRVFRPQIDPILCETIRQIHDVTKKFQAKYRESEDEKQTLDRSIRQQHLRLSERFQLDGVEDASLLGLLKDSLIQSKDLLRQVEYWRNVKPIVIWTGGTSYCRYLQESAHEEIGRKLGIETIFDPRASNAVAPGALRLHLGLSPMDAVETSYYYGFPGWIPYDPDQHGPRHRSFVQKNKFLDIWQIQAATTFAAKGVTLNYGEPIPYIGAVSGYSRELQWPPDFQVLRSLQPFVPDQRRRGKYRTRRRDRLDGMSGTHEPSTILRLDMAGVAVPESAVSHDTDNSIVGGYWTLEYQVRLRFDANPPRVCLQIMAGGAIVKEQSCDIDKI